MLVNHADSLDRDYAEIIGPQRALSCAYVRALKEIVQNLYVHSCDVFGLSIEVIAEEIAVEIVTESLEERIQK